MNTQEPLATTAPDEDEGITIDTSNDITTLNTNKECWDDLSHLKNELAATLLNFVVEIERATTSPELLSALGADRQEFDKTVNVFYSDVNRFTEQIQSLRSQHEHLSGGIDSMDDLNLFTRLSMSYQTLQIELHSLLGPTMANIILILHQALPSKIAVKPAEPAQESPDV